MKKYVKFIIITIIIMFVLASISYFAFADPWGNLLRTNRYFFLDEYCYFCISVLLLEIPVIFFVSFLKKRKNLSTAKKELMRDENANIDEINNLNKKIAKEIFFLGIKLLLCIIALVFVYYKYHAVNSVVAKPIIYLYPEEETEVTVTLGNSQNITCSYPKYMDGWKVIAKPNDDLVDTKTGRNLYALYWEGKNSSILKDFEEGFCVKGEDTASFLEEKLSILGLNEREAEEFIVYWLPRLEANKYNLIRFQTAEEIEEYMPLNITPKPDTTIRVMMEWKGVNKAIELPEQELITPERTGFVAVEWGGTER